MCRRKVFLIKTDSSVQKSQGTDKLNPVGELICSEKMSHEVISTYCQEIRQCLATSEINAFLVDEAIAQNSPEFLAELKKTGLPILTNEQPVIHQTKPIARTIKRVSEIVLSVFGLLFTVIIGIVIYPIMQAQSPGPILFVQKRVGKNGKLFDIYKFRSMYRDAEDRKNELVEHNEHESDLMFKIENDPRIFPFGKIIRRWSIDELPQFINVLKGDMSLIGTRPPTVDEVSKYELHHFKRLAMKPGITGMWQVSGRSNIQDFEEVVKLDASYIDNWSLWLDIKIFFKTFKAVLTKEGSK